MTDDARPELVEQAVLYTSRCTRCRTVEEFDDPLQMQAAMMAYYSLGSMIFCPECSDVLNRIRLPFLQAGTDAVIEEINEYHRLNPVETEAPAQGAVLQLVQDKEVH